MAAENRQLVLNAFLKGVGHHEAAWRHPSVNARGNIEIEQQMMLAQMAEAAKLDSLFYADTFILRNPAREPSENLDPAVLLAALSAVTERIGLIGTATTTFEEPFSLARKFATLDLISSGRAAWNVVTTAAAAAADNFGFTEFPSPEERYDRAGEFLELCQGLWRGWDADAVIADKENGRYADSDRVRPINHKGKHFASTGPLPVGRSLQGEPVIVQAGSSGPGIVLAATYAEAVFTAQRSIDEGREFYAKIKQAAREAGRNPDEVKVLPGIVTVIGHTQEEADAKLDELDSLMVLDHALLQLAGDVGLPVEELDLDKPLPENVRPVEEHKGGRARYELTLNLARSENLTVRELLTKLGSGRGHQVMAGTPERIADTITEWFETGASDGFNVMPATLPDGLRDFVDHVVPILQDRGLFRREYTGRTLREHYGLAIPSTDRAPLRMPKL